MKPIHCYAEQFFFLEVFCFVHQTNTFKINNAVHFSHSQNCKVNYLKLQIWHSKLLQSIMFTWALQLIYAHGGQCPSWVLSEVRLCASDPVQDCIKGEPLCNPCCDVVYYSCLLNSIITALYCFHKIYQTAPPPPPPPATGNDPLSKNDTPKLMKIFITWGQPTSSQARKIQVKN